jgi:hypothetical protein
MLSYLYMSNTFYLLPNFLMDGVMQLIFRYSEMLFPQLYSQVVNFLYNLICWITENDVCFGSGFDDETELGIAVTLHTAVVYVGRSTDEIAVIDYHEFGMKVYYLGDRLIDD